MNLINSKEKHFYYQEAGRSGLLTLEEYAIYCFLLQYVDADKGYTYTSLSTIQKSLNTSRKRVIKNLNSLKDKGFIDWDSGNSTRSNTYFFTHYSKIKEWCQIDTRLQNDTTWCQIDTRVGAICPKGSGNLGTPKEKKEIYKEIYKESNDSSLTLTKEKSNQNTILIINTKENEYNYTQDDVDNYRENLQSYLSDSHTSDKFFTWYEYDEADDYSKFYDIEIDNNVLIAKRK